MMFSAVLTSFAASLEPTSRYSPRVSVGGMLLAHTVHRVSVVHKKETHSPVDSITRHSRTIWIVGL
jgi:hypothetical protein